MEDPKNMAQENTPKPDAEELSRELGTEELGEVAGGTVSGGSVAPPPPPR
jgi:hypothetical protein